MEEDLYLIYVNRIGQNSDDYYEYEFFFSKDPDSAWGESWNELCPSACGDLKPSDDSYDEIFHLTSDINFFCAQENSCYSMADAIDHCIAIANEDINDLDEYPTPYRIVFQFGEKYEKVEEKLASRSQFFKEHIFEDE